MSRDDDLRTADAEPDRWLRAALRHAPDAELTAPAALSELILREARAVAATSAPARAPNGLVQGALALWSWLARPPVAAGFASVMVVTLIGLMWHGQPMDEALRVPAPVAPAVAPTEAAAATPAAAPIAPAPATEATVKQAREPKREAAPTRSVADREVDRETLRKAPSPPASPALSPSPAPMTPVPAVAPTAADAPIAAKTGEAASADAAVAPGVASVMLRDATLDRYLERRASGEAAAPPRSLAGRAHAAPLQELRSAVAEAPQRWTWQADDHETHAMTPALRGWLAELGESAEAARLGPDGDATTLRLFRDGRLYGTLTLEAGRVQLQLAGARRIADQPAAASGAAPTQSLKGPAP